MAGLRFKLPTVNAVMSLGITMLALMFILRFTPETFKKWFRV